MANVSQKTKEILFKVKDEVKHAVHSSYRMLCGVCIQIPEMIKAYVQKQLEGDLTNDQISLKKIYGPVYGEQEKHKKENNRF